MTKKPILMETPAEIRTKHANIYGFKFLLFNVSRLCNQRCPFCWTAETLVHIKKQAKPEAIEWLNDEIMYALLCRFKERSGEVVAVMADGEPLIGVNYIFIKRLATVCSKLGLGMLLFTNGELLTEKTIKELGLSNPRISYSISINAGSETVYDKLQGVEGTYKRVIANKESWKKYNEKTSNNLHRIGIHTVISSDTTENELEIIKRLVGEIGDIPWIVTTMGSAGDARVNESIIPKDSNLTKELIAKYGTGPTAKDPSKHNCSYIVSEYHDGCMYGITIHPFNSGSIQPCPYLSQFGSSKWFSLRQYIEENSHKILGDEDIARWLDYAVLIDAIITTAAFKVVNYDYCIMRHNKIRDIELFLAALNLEMEQRINGNYQNPKFDNYFVEIVKLVSDAVLHVAEYRFGKKIEVDIDKIKKVIRSELPFLNKNSLTPNSKPFTHNLN